MDIILEIATTLLSQLQKPTLAFLIGGMVLAALGSKFEVPDPVYKFIVIVLLLKVGLGAGISVRNADLMALLVPAVGAAVVGVVIVLLGSKSLARWRGVSEVDGLATAGMFGAVSASTLAAGMAILDDEGIAYEGFIGALYPFMDVAALVTAIVLARLSLARKVQTSVAREAQTNITREAQTNITVQAESAMNQNLQGDGTATLTAPTLGSYNMSSGGYSGDSSTATARFGGVDQDLLRGILVDTLRSPAISALLLGLAIGILGQPESVYKSFYEPLFRGLLSILMLIMGMEAWARLSELRKVAHAYVLYGLAAPFVHGLLGFGAGLIAHELTGFSTGGVVLLAVMAASSSDISGPPTMRGAVPEANPSSYVGTSTGLGTPVAILSIPLYVALAQTLIGW